MLLILLFLAIAAGCIAMDWTSLKGRVKLRDRVVYGVLWMAGITVTVCTVLKIPLPSPLLIIIYIYKPFNDAVQLLT